MNKKINDFNIHDIVKFRVVNSDNFVKRHFNRVFKEYSYFISKNVEEPDFVVYFGNFVPKTQSSVVLEDGKYAVNYNYLYVEDSHKSASWKLEIENFESDVPTTIKISSNILGSMFVTNWIVDSIIRWELDKKGYPMVHGSCVSRNGYAYLFPARSGAGKTTTALHFIKKDFSFLGDDYLILDRNAVLCFPSLLNIFMYNLTPLIYDSLSLDKKLGLHLKSLIYKLTFGYAKFLTPIDLAAIIPDKIAKRAQLRSIHFLSAADSFEVETLSKEECINHLLFNNKLDSFPFYKYMMEYSYVFPDSDMATYWTKYKNNLQNSLDSDIPIHMIKVPRKYDSKTLSNLVDIIENSINE